MATKTKPKLRKGDRIQFHAERISIGNPVKGVVTSTAKDGFELKLDHDIEGLVTYWDAGAIKHFHYGLISNIKKITNGKS